MDFGIWDDVLMSTTTPQYAVEILTRLKGLEIGYFINSADLDLLDIGFGKCTEDVGIYGHSRFLCPYVLHVMSPWQVSSSEAVFHEGVGTDMLTQLLKGNIIQDVIIKNNNLLDIIFENCEIEMLEPVLDNENWCLISKLSPRFHLVGSKGKIEYWPLS